MNAFSRWCLLATLLLSPGVMAAPLGLTQLMTALARQPQGAASFVETKTLAMLEQPLESSGTLLFVAPARLEKRTLKPRSETMVLDGDQLTLTRGARSRVLRLQDTPELAAMVESIRGTLAGDRKALERVYTLSLEGDLERWSLKLVPIDAKLARLIERIRIEGTGGEVRSVDILQADGDRSVMQIKTAVGQ